MSNEPVTESHLDSAKKFFVEPPADDAAAKAAADKAAADKAAADKAAADKAAADKAAADKAAADKAVAEAATKKGPDLSSVVKLPGQKSDEPTKTAGSEEKPLDPIDKDLVAPEEKSKSRPGWDELKKRGQEAFQRAHDLEQQLAAVTKERDALKTTAPADEATKARNEELEKQNRVFSERLKVLDLRSHPEFQTKFLAPQEAAKNAMSALLRSEEITTNVEDLLALKGKKFNAAVSEVLEQLTPFARVKFQKGIDQYLESQLGAEEALSKADEFLKTAKTENGARSRAVFDEVAGQFKGVFLAAQIDDKTADADKAPLAAYNAALASVGKAAEQLAFGQLDEAGIATVAHKAAMFDFTISQGIPRIAALFGAELNKAQSKVGELEKQLADMTAAKPRINGGSGMGGSDEKVAQPSHLEAARAFFPAAA